MPFEPLKSSMPSKRALLPQTLRMEILCGPAARGVKLVSSKRSRGESAGQGLQGGTGGAVFRRVLLRWTGVKGAGGSGGSAAPPPSDLLLGSGTSELGAGGG